MDVPLINLAVNSDFLDEPRFADAYLAGSSTLAALGDHGKNFVYDAWRLRIALWAGEQASRLPGDFVECGVHTGFLSKAIVRYLNFQDLANKRFFLVDTFEGVPADQFSDDERDAGLDARAKTLYPRDVFEICSKNFEHYTNVTLIRGRVPEVLASLPVGPVAYLSIDMNCAEPEIAAVRHFWDRVVPGGVILFDDYGATGHHNQKLAVDALALELENPILPVPSGQALMIKLGVSR